MLRREHVEAHCSLFGARSTAQDCRRILRTMQELRAPQRMHTYDARLADLVFDYMRDRLQLDPVPLDHPGDRQKLDAVLSGLLTAEGHDPSSVLSVYADHLAPAVISCDSPRFLSFIPAAPTKAALLFDMVVSCASLQGISWLEAAGAIAAENQVLRLLADLAGMPEQAGGCFVTGGSAGNLSALVVARDTARHRLGLGPYDRVRIAVSDQAHSSVHNTLNIIGVEAFPVPTTEHRFTGGDLRSALARDTDTAPLIGVVATAGTTNAGIVDDLAGIADAARELGLWFHVDRACGGATTASSTPTRSWSTRTSGCSHPSTAPPFCTGTRIWRRPYTPRTPHTSTSSTPTRPRSGTP